MHSLRLGEAGLLGGPSRATRRTPYSKRIGRREIRGPGAKTPLLDRRRQLAERCVSRVVELVRGSNPESLGGGVRMDATLGTGSVVVVFSVVRDLRVVMLSRRVCLPALAVLQRRPPRGV